jgi:hypothetical protein
MPEGGPGMCIVRAGSVHALHFKNIVDIKAGRPALATFAGVHQSEGLGNESATETRHGEWRYIRSQLGPAEFAIDIQLVDGEFIKVTDRDLYLDVAFWSFKAGTGVNFVGGNNSSRSKLRGGGRSWIINSDGTISSKYHPEFVLGAKVAYDAEDLEGCWGCYCFPCGSAINNVQATGKDTLDEAGIFFLFGIFPLPYIKRRTRKKAGRNRFAVNINSDHDPIEYRTVNCIDFGPVLGFGCRLCGGNKHNKV